MSAMVRRYRVWRVGWLPDGCQLVLFEMEPINGKYGGMIVTPADGAVRPGDAISCGIAEDGAPFDGRSTVRFRINDGAWVDCHEYGDEHKHVKRQEGELVWRLVHESPRARGGGDAS